MEEIKIEKGIPLPAGSGETLTNKMRNMQVGDSFTYPIVKRNSTLSCARLAGIKIATRTEGDFVRVWRIA